MPNKIFDALYIEKVEQFILSFSDTSKKIFYDDEKKQIFHNGEYGMYRESIVRDFLKFIVPPSLDISSGFLITTLDDVSSQCDIIIFDSKITPLYEGEKKQRFFPIEPIYAIGEIKSTLSKTDFKKALNKLAKNKALSERMLSIPPIIKKDPSKKAIYDPKNDDFDIIPSFLICQKLNFDISNIEQEVSGFYDKNIAIRHRHNFVLSIDDGLLVYNLAGRSFPYNQNLKDMFVKANDKHAHFKVFLIYLFMVISNKTLFYPELANYIKRYFFFNIFYIICFLSWYSNYWYVYTF
jgi:Domain of unknown function (DUF6602)